MVYCSFEIFLLVPAVALNQTHQRGSKAQSSRRPSEPPGVFGGGAGEAVPPQNAEYRCCYCVLYLARALMLTFTRAALLWRYGTVLAKLQGVVRFAFAEVAEPSDRAVRAARAAVQLVTLRGYTLLLPLVALQAQQMAIHFDVRLPSILPIN